MELREVDSVGAQEAGPGKKAKGLASSSPHLGCIRTLLNIHIHTHRD